MGLDMNLRKKTYIGNKWKEPAKIVKVNLLDIKDERISEITEDIYYWRKANAIHNWFVKNVVQNDDYNGDDVYVSTDNLKKLLTVCEKVIKASKLIKGKVKNGYKILDGGLKQPIMKDGKFIEDPTIAKELLPTTDGFFFGSTDYDEYYLNDIKETAKMIKELLETDPNGDFYYSASW